MSNRMSFLQTVQKVVNRFVITPARRISRSIRGIFSSKKGGKTRHAKKPSPAPVPAAAAAPAPAPTPAQPAPVNAAAAAAAVAGPTPPTQSAGKLRAANMRRMKFYKPRKGRKTHRR